jgi:hypothetical protein
MFVKITCKLPVSDLNEFENYWKNNKFVIPAASQQAGESGI